MWNLNLFNNIILLILAIGTVIGVSDYVGALPPKMRERLQLNRIDNTIKLLEDMGMDFEKHRKHNHSLRFPKDLSLKSVKKSTIKSLKQFRVNKTVTVGHLRPTEVPYYYDLIGATCKCENAVYYAKLMSAYWASYSSDLENCSYFDFIVTPKCGSPLLGYEFAKLVKKPLVLHESNARFKSYDDDFRAKFNCTEIPKAGSVALIVDDSTTGGTMVMDAIEDLRHFGYKVDSCFVIFEPICKDAKVKLSSVNVDLVSITKTHKKDVNLFRGDVASNC